MMTKEWKEELLKSGYKEEEILEPEKLFSISFPWVDVCGDKFSERALQRGIEEVADYMQERLKCYTTFNLGEFLSVIEDQFGVMMEIDSESAYKLLRHFAMFMRRSAKGESK